MFLKIWNNIIICGCDVTAVQGDKAWDEPIKQLYLPFYLLWESPRIKDNDEPIKQLYLPFYLLWESPGIKDNECAPYYKSWKYEFYYIIVIWFIQVKATFYFHTWLGLLDQGYLEVIYITTLSQAGLKTFVKLFQRPPLIHFINTLLLYII